MRSELGRIQHELQTQQETIKENEKKINQNKTPGVYILPERGHLFPKIELQRGHFFPKIELLRRLGVVHTHFYSYL